MKTTAVLAAVAVIGWGAALAADTKPATTATPSSANATPVKQTSLKACNKQADTKNLTGQARATFVKNCRGAKPR